MTTHSFDRDDPDERLRIEAADWLARLNGPLADEERKAFEQWIGADPRHREVLAELQGNIERLRQLRRHVSIPSGEPDPDLLARGHGGHRFLRWSMASVAAAAGIALLVTLLPNRLPPSPEQPAEFAFYETEASGFHRVELLDGSVVELNQSTRIEVRFTSDHRRIRLVAGEAHFEVAKDSTRPFTVETGRVKVQAVGTAFNVRSTEGEIRVLVTEGQIVLLAGGQANASADRVPAEPQIQGGAAYLGMGEQAIVDATAPTLQPRITQLERAQIEQELAWTGPRLHFQGIPLSEALRQFNAHNTLQVEPGDESVGQIAIGGSFAAKDVDAFLRLLSRYDNIEVRRLNAVQAVVQRRTQ